MVVVLESGKVTLLRPGIKPAIATGNRDDEDELDQALRLFVFPCISNPFRSHGFSYRLIPQKTLGASRDHNYLRDPGRPLNFELWITRPAKS